MSVTYGKWQPARDKPIPAASPITCGHVQYGTCAVCLAENIRRQSESAPTPSAPAEPVNQPCPRCGSTSNIHDLCQVYRDVTREWWPLGFHWKRVTREWVECPAGYGVRMARVLNGEPEPVPEVKLNDCQLNVYAPPTNTTNNTCGTATITFQYFGLEDVKDKRSGADRRKPVKKSKPARKRRTP